MRRSHRVPLSRQAQEVIREVRAVGNNSRYLFPAINSNLRPMSEGAVTSALRRMGYSGEEMTGHPLHSGPPPSVFAPQPSSLSPLNH